MHTGITQVIFLVFCTYSYTQNNCIYIFNCKSYTKCVQCCIFNVFNSVIFCFIFC